MIWKESPTNHELKNDHGFAAVLLILWLVWWCKSIPCISEGRDTIHNKVFTETMPVPAGKAESSQSQLCLYFHYEG